jgi:hypothetical protein
MSTASPMNTPEIIQAITPLIDAFERFGIPYYIGGSVASSVHGKRRATQDVDIVADIQRQHIQPLVKLLANDYYIDDEMIRGALQHHSTFNVLHNETGVKVDVFVLTSSILSRQGLQRAREEVIEPGSRPFYFASPEDVILNKLNWWKMGGGTSTRQWNDLIEVIKHQAGTLDRKYLQQSAPLIGIADILTQAFIDAGMP